MKLSNYISQQYSQIKDKKYRVEKFALRHGLTVTKVKQLLKGDAIFSGGKIYEAVK